ncbi:MAG: (2Fe-2S)-binding protein [Oligoflexales bacterium]
MEDYEEKTQSLDHENEQDRKDRLTKQLARVVCICKGVPLSKVLPALKGCEDVSDVNRKANIGDGGCQGRRCGPRVRALLKKK